MANGDDEEQRRVVGVQSPISFNLAVQGTHWSLALPLGLPRASLQVQVIHLQQAAGRSFLLSLSFLDYDTVLSLSNPCIDGIPFKFTKQISFNESAYMFALFLISSKFLRDLFLKFAYVSVLSNPS